MITEKKRCRIEINLKFHRITTLSASLRKNIMWASNVCSVVYILYTYPYLNEYCRNWLIYSLTMSFTVNQAYANETVIK